ncbi:MAG: hypothetical protein C4308_13535 [Chitinophagaceae bacterium]
MERIKVLINKLKEQADENSSPSQMLITLQMLQNELCQLQSTGHRNLGTSKVAVMLPKVVNVSADEQQPVATVQAEEKPAVVKEEKETYRPRTTTKKEQSYNLFDPLVEIPTLSQQEQVRQVIEPGYSELNERLKQNTVEVAEIVKFEPIKDLRKAIGINDRFVFINDLFRGDEAMYERSIKTINSFNIYPEAEYWINRELVVKLGWGVDNEIVKHFYQLVKRRFA